MKSRPVNIVSRVIADMYAHRTGLWGALRNRRTTLEGGVDTSRGPNPKPRPFIIFTFAKAHLLVLHAHVERDKGTPATLAARLLIALL